jgi:hypothetical protein
MWVRVPRWGSVVLDAKVFGSQGQRLISVAVQAPHLQAHVGAPDSLGAGRAATSVLTSEPSAVTGQGLAWRVEDLS